MKTSIIAAIITGVFSTSAALADSAYSVGNNGATFAGGTTSVQVQQLIGMRDQTRRLAEKAASTGNSNTASQLHEAAARIQAQIDHGGVFSAPVSLAGNDEATVADGATNAPIQQLIHMRDQTRRLAEKAASTGNSNTASQLHEAAARIQAQINQDVIAIPAISAGVDALADNDDNDDNDELAIAVETIDVPVQQLISMRDQTRRLAEKAASTGKSDTASQLHEAVARIQAQIDQVRG